MTASLLKLALQTTLHDAPPMEFTMLCERPISFPSEGATLIDDHRHFGVSDGEPRHEINPWVQCRGYRDALDFAATLDTIDVGRMALWGDSYTGGQVVVVSACDARPTVIVAQCPVFGPSVPDLAPSLEVMAQIAGARRQSASR